MKKNLLLIAITLFVSSVVMAQPGSALDELDEITKDDVPEPQYAYATFKGARLINGHSVEMPGKGELIWIFAHRFGSMENGLYDVFGFDRATLRMGLEYTLPTDNICFGIGRSTYKKTVDGFIKAKVFRQQTGVKNVPFTLTLLSGMAYSNDRAFVPNQEVTTPSRISYVNQILLARKFSNSISLQLMPTLIHKNLVRTANEQNTFFSMGVGGRVKLSRRVSLNLEYFGLLPNQNVPEARGHSVKNTLAVGFDIETGGHVFQLQFTNAVAMYDGGYISETASDFFAPDGAGVHFGFNFTRTFSFGKKRRDFDE